MTFIIKTTAVALAIGILVMSVGELSAQQRGTISIDRAVALPLTTPPGDN
jgi:hypothetical protein